MSNRDLYSVTMTREQIAKALEAYALADNINPALVARAELPESLDRINVRVSTKRKSPSKGKASG